MTTMMGKVFDDKVEPLETRMVMLEQKNAQCSTAGSNVRAGTGNASGLKHLSIPAPNKFDCTSMDFTPRWIEIKGWVSNFNTRANALQKTQVFAWLQAVKKQLENQLLNLQL